MRRGVLLLFFLSILNINLYAQLDRIYTYLEMQYAELDAELDAFSEGQVVDNSIIGSVEELLTNAKEYYATLLTAPLNINSATATDLEQLAILSTFQIEALLSYRDEHGAILSASELELVVGFNSNIVTLLNGFINYSKDGYTPSNVKFFKGDLLYKSSINLEHQEWYDPITAEELEKSPNSRYIGTPFYSELKYKGSWGDKYSIGVIAQNDAGEPFLSPLYLPMADFLSLNFTINDITVTKDWNSTIIVGDYTAKLGQGLTIYKGFSMGGGTTVSSLYKRGDILKGYSSGDESNYLRGVGVTLRRESILERGCNWEFNLFASNKGVDANVVDGKYTSIVTDGLHNTISSYAKRHSMRQTLFGGRAEYEGATFKIGVNGVTYCYSLENGRKISNYNMYQQFNGWWGNLSLDYYLLLGRGRLFGELAIDCGGGTAAVAGYLYAKGAVEVGTFLRGYGVKYIAPEANCYGSSSGCSNQRGATLFISHNSWGSKYEGGVDFVYYPWERYNIAVSSLTTKLFIKWSGMVEHWSGYVKGNYSYASYNSVSKFGVKVSGAHELSARFTTKFRGEIAKVVDIKPWSINGCTELVYSSLSRKLKLYCSLGAFFAPDWSNRLYVYQGDLPSSFNSLLLYGRGFYGYLMAKWELFRDWDLFFKQDIIFKQGSIFSENREESLLGFGEPSSKSKLKLGLAISF